MSLNIDVTGPGRWELAYAAGKDTPPERKTNRFYKRQHGRLIDPFDIPVVFDSHIIAAAAAYIEAPTTWYNCGNFIQLVLGTTINEPDAWNQNYTGSEPMVVDRKRLRLNQSLELFIFQPVSAEMRLGFEPLPWIPRFSFGIYQFLGTATDTTEDLINAARTQLVPMDSKLNTILERI